jgi:hypothetical protein
MRVDRHASRGLEPAPALNSAAARQSGASDMSANDREPTRLVSCPITPSPAPASSQRLPQLPPTGVTAQIRSPAVVARRAKVPSPGRSTILTFDSDRVAYDADRHAVQFPASDGSGRIICEISLAALMSMAAAETPEMRDESLIAIYRRLGAKIRKIATWKYLAGELGPDGRIVVATADLHGRCDQPPTTRPLSRNVGQTTLSASRRTSN